MNDLINRLRHEAMHTSYKPTKPWDLLIEAADEIDRLRAALELAESALELGCDALRAEAERYHAEMKGYRPERHQQADDDYNRAEMAWKVVRAALKEKLND